MWGAAIPFHWGEVLGGNYAPSSEKNDFSLEMAFWCFLSCTFVLLFAKKIKFSARSDLVDIKDVLLGNSEYSVGIMGLISFLLHCNASNLVFKIVKQ